MDMGLIMDALSWEDGECSRQHSKEKMHMETDHVHFPGSAVVGNLPSNAGGAGSIPGGGAKIPRASWPKK